MPVWKGLLYFFLLSGAILLGMLNCIICFSVLLNWAVISIGLPLVTNLKVIVTLVAIYLCFTGSLPVNAKKDLTGALVQRTFDLLEALWVKPLLALLVFIVFRKVL